MVYREKDPKKWTKDGRKWYFKIYKKENNKLIQKRSKYFLTKKEAEQEEAVVLLKRDMPYSKPFEVVAKDYFDNLYKIRKESTVYSYISAFDTNIKPYLSRFNILDINTHIINNWKLEMDKNGFKTSYKNKLYNILNNIFIFAMKNYNLQNNPVSVSGRFENVNEDIVENKIRYITLDNFNKLLSVIEDEHWKSFFIFLFYTGVRKGELQALTWNDIDFENKEITINKTLSVKTQQSYKITSTKNYVNRKIKISKTLYDNLLEHKKRQEQYVDFSNNWFIFGNSRFLAQTTIDNHKHKYFKMAELKEITIHEFRHSHVSLLINEYIKSGQTDTTKFFLMMANRLGHSIGVMQKTYMHLLPNVQNEIVDILDNL